MARPRFKHDTDYGMPASEAVTDEIYSSCAFQLMTRSAHSSQLPCAPPPADARPQSQVISLAEGRDSGIVAGTFLTGVKNENDDVE
jgi:hypothetical protein